MHEINFDNHWNSQVLPSDDQTCLLRNPLISSRIREATGQFQPLTPPKKNEERISEESGRVASCDMSESLWRAASSLRDHRWFVMLAAVLYAAWWAPLQNATYGLVPAAPCARTHTSTTQAALVLCVLANAVVYPHSISHTFIWTFCFGSIGFLLMQSAFKTPFSCDFGTRVDWLISIPKEYIRAQAFHFIHCWPWQDFK